MNLLILDGIEVIHISQLRHFDTIRLTTLKTAPAPLVLISGLLCSRLSVQPPLQHALPPHPGPAGFLQRGARPARADAAAAAGAARPARSRSAGPPAGAAHLDLAPTRRDGDRDPAGRSASWEVLIVRYVGTAAGGSVRPE